MRRIGDRLKMNALRTSILYIQYLCRAVCIVAQRTSRHVVDIEPNAEEVHPLEHLAHAQHVRLRAVVVADHHVPEKVVVARGGRRRRRRLLGNERLWTFPDERPRVHARDRGARRVRRRARARRERCRCLAAAADTSQLFEKRSLCRGSS